MRVQGNAWRNNNIPTLLYNMPIKVRFLNESQTVFKMKFALKNMD